MSVLTAAYRDPACTKLVWRVVQLSVALLALTVGSASAVESPAADAAESKGPEPIRIDAHAVISERAPIPSAYLAPDSPPNVLAGGLVYLQSPDQSARVGIWESAPGKIRLDMQFNEYVRVLEGVSVIRSVDGRSWTFKAGDSFILSKGFKGEAEQKTHFRKEYVDFGVTPVQ